MPHFDCSSRYSIIQRTLRLPAFSLLLMASAVGSAQPAQAATFNYLATPVEIGPTTAGTWEDVNVSAWVPAGATGVIVQFVGTGSNLDFGVRKNGSSDTWMVAHPTAYGTATGFLMTGVDAGRVLEIYEESTDITTYLIGYTMEGVTFFTNAIDKSLSTTGSYQDIDISSNTGSDTAIGAILHVQNTDASAAYALRKKGSTDDRLNELKNSRTTSCLIGVDANEVCEMKIASTTLDAYLIGYVTEGAVFFTNGIDKSTGTSGSYVDVDITADIGSDDANGAILQVVSDASRGFGVRKNGASYDYYGDTKNEWAYTAIDANDVFEQKIEDTDKDLFLVGYTLAVSPPSISSAANQSFYVGDYATAMSTMTVTDPVGGMITAANDIRIRVPSGFNMDWRSAVTTATIGGAASAKVSTTVTYEDGDDTLVLDVTSDFAAGDVITVSGLQFMNFTAFSSASNLELEINNDDVVTGTDSKTIQIGAPIYRSIGTDSGPLYSTGTASTTAGSAVVTFSGAVLPTDIGAGDKLTFSGGGPSTLFSDDFNDATITGWTDIGVDPMEESGGTLHTIGTDDCHYSIDAGSGWTDYTYSADLQANDDDVQGISFRVQDADNYYLLRQTFGDSKYGTWDIMLQKVVGGTPTDLATPIDNFGSAPGQVDSETTWYTFKVEVSGTSIKAYVDNVLKFDITDSTYSGGTAGVWTETQLTGSFDDVLVTGSAGPAEYYILSRDSDTQVTLQSAASSTLTNETYTIKRAYNTLQAWEDDRQGDLVGEGRREVGVAYNDGAFTSPVTISGSTTDASHYMMLTVAEGARHLGVAGGGVMIDGTSGLGQAAIDVQDDYTRVEWFEVANVLDLNAALNLAGDYTVASNMLIHDITGDAVTMSGTGATLRNSVIYDTANTAVEITAGTATIENNTIYGAGDDGVSAAAGTTVTIRNTISVGSTNYDFELLGTIAYFGYNLFSTVSGFDPDLYQGGNQIPPGDLENLFVSVVDGSEDFHLEPTANRAGNLGLDLSAEFGTDLNGATRTGTWDIGAHEGVAGTEPLSPKLLGWTEIEP